jgi:hypothetical protein
VSADADSGSAVVRPRGLVRPRQGLITASGWGALLTGAVAILAAIALRAAGIGWLPWLACALPATAAGALCLTRRRATSTAPLAVFATCAVAGGYAVQIPDGRSGLALATSVLLVLCAVMAVVIAGIVTAVMIATSGAGTGTSPSASPNFPAEPPPGPSRQRTGAPCGLRMVDGSSKDSLMPDIDAGGRWSARRGFSR